MDVTFIHADDTLAEIGVLNDIMEADIEICTRLDAAVVDNSFSFIMPEASWAEEPILEGHYLYWSGTEWGGVVTEVIHDTAARTIQVQGVCWRGMLFQKVICPPTGEAYKVVADLDANQAISAVVGTSFGDLYKVDSSECGIEVSARWRYQTYAAGLHKTLKAYGLRLEVLFTSADAHVTLSARPVVDHSDEIDFSQDYGVDFTSSSGKKEQYNHCIGLGSGELAERTVLHLYRVDSTYYTTKPECWNDAEERTVIMDYPNAESESELLSSMLDRLSSYAPTKSIDIDQVTVDEDIDLGDIVGARDRLTGMAGKAEIVRKILTIKEGQLKIEAKVE